ncbi:MAG: 50S ribosomal protein L21 [Oscillospiraceae bacterium]|nr:50S ribosomal protein L21 [Oscillospiraceae bacterium]
MYAVIMTGGKQYQVNEGDVIFVEKLDAEADTEVVFDQVLMIGKDKTQKIGTPIVKGATVTAKVLKNGKGKKIRVSTYRPKKGSKRTLGHRQPYTKVEITGISEKKAKAAEPVAEENN